jgi:hypothetical protein
MEAGKVFTGWVRDPVIKIWLMLEGEKTVNESLRQALLLAARPKKNSRTFWGSQLSPTEQRDQRISMLELWASRPNPE